MQASSFRKYIICGGKQTAKKNVVKPGKKLQWLMEEKMSGGDRWEGKKITWYYL